MPVTALNFDFVIYCRVVGNEQWMFDPLLIQVVINLNTFHFIVLCTAQVKMERP